MDATLIRPSRIERLGDGFIVAFGVWTLTCNASVAAGRGLSTLVWAGALCVTAALFLARKSAAPPQAAEPEGQRAPSARARRLPLLFGVAALLLAASGADVLATWAAAVLGLLLAAWAFRNPPKTARGSGPAGTGVVLALAAAFALLPLFAHRGSPDDGFYVNIAAHAVAHPNAALLANDTLHGISDLPIMYSVYRLHSFELLGAAISRTTGIEAVRVMHSILPVLAAFFAVIALGRLLRRLAPDRWVLATLLAVALIALEGEVPQSIGTFSTLRFQQGKALLLTVCLPLLLSAAIDFARAPNRRAFVLLALAQIGALGASVTAIWLAPAVAGLGLIAGVAWNRRGLFTLGTGLGSALYPLGAGLAFLASTRAESALEVERTAGVQLVAHGNEAIGTSVELISATWETVMGSGSLALLALALLSLGWILAPTQLARRVAVVLPLGLCFGFLNPIWAIQVAGNVTGGPTFWRVLWLMPWAALLGLLAASPQSLGLPRVARVGASLALAAALGFGLFGARGLTQGVTWKPLGMNVPEEAFEHARRISGATPEGSSFLGPRQIGTSLLQIDGTRTPIVSHRNWLNIQRHRIGLQDTDRRLRLLDYVLGLPQPRGDILLREAFIDYDLQGVAFERGTANTKAIRGTLERAGFRLLLASETYESWVRP